MLSSEKNPIDELPEETQLYLYEFLPIPSLLALSQANKNQKRLTSDDQLWKSKFKKFFPELEVPEKNSKALFFENIAKMLAPLNSFTTSFGLQRVNVFPMKGQDGYIISNIPFEENWQINFGEFDINSSKVVVNLKKDEKLNKSMDEDDEADEADEDEREYKRSRSGFHVKISEEFAPSSFPCDVVSGYCCEDVGEISIEIGENICDHPSNNTQYSPYLKRAVLLLRSQDQEAFINFWHNLNRAQQVLCLRARDGFGHSLLETAGIIDNIALMQFLLKQLEANLHPLNLYLFEESLLKILDISNNHYNIIVEFMKIYEIRIGKIDQSIVDKLIFVLIKSFRGDTSMEAIKYLLNIDGISIGREILHRLFEFGQNEKHEPLYRFIFSNRDKWNRDTGINIFNFGDFTVTVDISNSDECFCKLMSISCDNAYAFQLMLEFFPDNQMTRENILDYVINGGKIKVLYYLFEADPTFNLKNAKQEMHNILIQFILYYRYSPAFVDVDVDESLKIIKVLLNKAGIDDINHLDRNRNLFFDLYDCISQGSLKRKTAKKLMRVLLTLGVNPDAKDINNKTSYDDRVDDEIKYMKQYMRRCQREIELDQARNKIQVLQEENMRIKEENTDLKNTIESENKKRKLEDAKESKVDRKRARVSEFSFLADTAQNQQQEDAQVTPNVVNNFTTFFP